MKLIKQLKLVLITVIFLLTFTASVFAQEIPIEVKISLGNSAGELKFFPDKLEFVAGKSYKLILDNPSDQKHYFTAKDFADAIWTKKVDAGNVEIKGAIRELEIRPGAVAVWVFTPMRLGNYDLYCSIPGHKEAGMIGKIAIAPKQ
jgi:uncharacterized cupredoxin-like copper-binding protein